MPSILFIHTNFPAQFGFLGLRLAREGWDVAFATRREDAQSESLRIIRFGEGREVTRGIHPYLAGSEQAVITGQQAARALIGEREAGYRPDIVMAHAGWGAGLFVPDIFPDAVYIPYVEWWYGYPPVDSVYEGDFSPSTDLQLRQRIRNTPMLLELAAGSFCLCPTRFQAGQFPRRFDPLIRVIHDGVDTALHAPAASRRFAAASALRRAASRSSASSISCSRCTAFASSWADIRRANCSISTISDSMSP